MSREPVMSAAELQVFLDEVFPQQKGKLFVEALRPMEARVCCPIDFEDLRPGGTVSGPTMFTVADCAFYAALLGMIGRKAMAVTTNLNMTFLRKPPKAAVIGEARILKLGRNLASGDVLVYSDGMDKAVAHAAVTYAIPSKL